MNARRGTVQEQIDRILILLRSKISEKGFTQLEVEEALGWGRSYISQLVTKQKTLRVNQMLSILTVIGEDAGKFFGELYHFQAHPALPADDEILTRLAWEVDRQKRELERLTKVLEESGLC